MAIPASGREALRTPSVRQASDSTVNPSETKGFFDRIQISYTILTRNLCPIYDYPAILCRCVVVHKPLPQLCTIGILQKRSYFHCFNIPWMVSINLRAKIVKDFGSGKYKRHKNLSVQAKGFFLPIYLVL
jgi:hypothetical protein